MRDRFLLQRSVAVAVALVAPMAISAYPIPPAPLWRLVHDADAIVLATVISVDAPAGAPPGTDDDHDPDDAATLSTARLQVIERWKGEPGAEIGVGFEPNMVFPARSPRFSHGWGTRKRRPGFRRSGATGSRSPT